MRKVWVSTVLLVVMVFFQQAAVQCKREPMVNKLESLSHRFSEQEKGLRETRVALWQLFKAFGDNYIAVVVYKLEAAEVLCNYEAHLVSSYAGTTDSAGKDYVTRALAELNMAKKRLDQGLEAIQEMRSYIPYPPVLEQMDKANTAMQSSMALTDEAIAVFRSLAE